MITPGKTITLRESILFKSVTILEQDFDEISLTELYSKTKRKFDGIDEFIYSLDVLFILNKVTVDLTTGQVRKC